MKYIFEMKLSNFDDFICKINIQNYYVVNIIIDLVFIIEECLF